MHAGRLTTQELKDLAAVGAKEALRRLEAQADAIKRTFPNLSTNGHTEAAVWTAPAVTRRKSRMSAAQRKAVSTRMRKYWADRRRKLAQ